MTAALAVPRVRPGAHRDTRLDAYDWGAIADHLDAFGWAPLEGILSARIIDAARPRLFHN